MFIINEETMKSFDLVSLLRLNFNDVLCILYLQIDFVDLSEGLSNILCNKILKKGKYLWGKMFPINPTTLIEFS